MATSLSVLPGAFIVFQMHLGLQDEFLKVKCPKLRQRAGEEPAFRKTRSLMGAPLISACKLSPVLWCQHMIKGLIEVTGSHIEFILQGQLAAEIAVSHSGFTVDKKFELRSVEQK
ncbi:hypothetical protein EV360DRAFT_68337 [Lentinula raphanica]|nr:hypothetical protein EV360DRAFT_68337 [Lentinula raphanica]